jgi:hypothetical protein
MLAPARRGETVTLDEVMHALYDFVEGQAKIDDVRAALESLRRAARRAALEEAAKLLEAGAKRWDPSEGAYHALIGYARDLRALAGEEAAR